MNRKDGVATWSLPVSLMKQDRNACTELMRRFRLNTEPPGTAAEGCSLRKMISNIVSPNTDYFTHNDLDFSPR